jgi:hypothetical protein
MDTDGRFAAKSHGTDGKHQIYGKRTLEKEEPNLCIYRRHHPSTKAEVEKEKMFAETDCFRFGEDGQNGQMTLTHDIKRVDRPP